MCKNIKVLRKMTLSFALLRNDVKRHCTTSIWFHLKILLYSMKFWRSESDGLSIYSKNLIGLTLPLFPHDLSEVRKQWFIDIFHKNLNGLTLPSLPHDLFLDHFLLIRKRSSYICTDLSYTYTYFVQISEKTI